MYVQEVRACMTSLLAHEKLLLNTLIFQVHVPVSPPTHPVVHIHTYTPDTHELRQVRLTVGSPVCVMQIDEMAKAWRAQMEKVTREPACP
jgi:hypothetical protein